MSSLAFTQPTINKQTVNKQISDYVHHFATITPDHEAVVFGDDRYSYAQLSQQVDQCAKAIMAMGVVKGNRVAVLCTPGSAFWITFLAATQIGAIWVGLNPKYRLQEMRYVVGDAKPKLLFAMAAFERDHYAENIRSLCEEYAFIERAISLTAPLPNSQTFAAFLTAANTVTDDQLVERQAAINAMDPALLVYTSAQPENRRVPYLRTMAYVLVLAWPTSILALHNLVRSVAFLLIM